MKICTKCGEEKPATSEYFPLRGKDKLKSSCRDCYNAYQRKMQKKWRKKNKNKVSKRMKKYYKDNKEKLIKKAKKYRENNPDKFKQKDREYYLKNREKKLEYQRQYRKEHPEQVKQSCRDWYWNNREYALKKGKEWREENYEQYRAYIRRWLKDNPDKKQRYYHQREAKKKRLLSDFTAKQWKECKKHFNNECAYCGRKMKKLTQDHFIPLADNGEYTDYNIIPSCRKCNSSKNDSDFFDWYPRQKFYSMDKKEKIINYLHTKYWDRYGEVPLTVNL